MRSNPKGLWVFFGGYEVLAGIALLIPAFSAAAALFVAAESIVVSAVYTRYGDKSPRMFTIAMALLAMVITYGRFNLAPL